VRPLIAPLLIVFLASCAGPARQSTDLRTRQEAACTAVIAAHVRRLEAEVASHWRSEDGDIAKIEARDGDRVHICDVDASGQVLGYIHPGA
jgi:hypothetical protein